MLNNIKVQTYRENQSGAIKICKYKYLSHFFVKIHKLDGSIDQGVYRTPYMINNKGPDSQKVSSLRQISAEILSQLRFCSS